MKKNTLYVFLIICMCCLMGCGRVVDNNINDDPVNGELHGGKTISLEKKVIARSRINLSVLTQTTSFSNASSVGDSGVDIETIVPPYMDFNIESSLSFTFDSMNWQEADGAISLDIKYNDLLADNIQGIYLNIYMDNDGLQGASITQNVIPLMYKECSGGTWESIQQNNSVIKEWLPPYFSGINEHLELSIKGDFSKILAQKYTGAINIEFVKVVNSEPDINDGLMAYYSFDNDLSDLSGNGNDLSINGNVATNNLDSVKGHSVEFEGNGYLHTPNFTRGYDDLSVSIWFKTDNPLNNYKLISSALWNSVSTGSGWMLGSHYPELWDVDHGDLRGGSAGPRSFNPGEWNHYVLTFRRGNSYLPTRVREYINGVMTNEIEHGNTKKIGDGMDIIKIANWKGYYFNGAIDEVRIYNREINSEEVNLLYDDQESQLLKISGNKIIDVSGQEVVFKGLGMANYVYDLGNSCQVFKQSGDWDHDSDDFALIKSWGFNHIRFYMNAEWFLDDNKAQAFEYIDKNIEWAKANNIGLILDMHIPQGGYNGPITQQDQNDFISMWTEISDHYKNESTVYAYDILNEPRIGDDSWWGTATDASASLFARTLQAIRGQGDKHIVILENPLNLDSGYTPFPQDIISRFNDDAILYSFHFYDKDWFTHQGANWESFEKYPTGNSYAAISEYISDVGESHAQGALNPQNWQLDGLGWVTPEIGSNAGHVQLISYNNSGTILFDNVVVLKKSSEGIISTVNVYNSRANEVAYNGNPVGWFSQYSGGEPAFEVNDASGYDDSCSFSISNTGEYGLWSSYAFDLEDGYEYQACAYLKGINATGWSKVILKWVNNKLPKEVLNESMNSLMDNLVANNVPVYCGEFGSINLAPGNDEYKWTEDVVDLFKSGFSYPLNWSYHMYRDYRGLDVQKRDDLGLISVPAYSDSSVNPNVDWDKIEVLTGYIQ